MEKQRVGLGKVPANRYDDFFMASPLQEIKHHRSKRRKNLESNSYNLTILQHNVQSLTNKLMELSAFLNTSLLNFGYFYLTFWFEI